ncbi:MAG: hypothetical protein IVW36_09540 [Dehalococcoidia bacterium]|nr:hypothetical protein [Dehalococcoidia bacterium]
MPDPQADAGRSRRRTGRILSLGYPLPGPLVDNYDFVSAPAFFDYDAIVVDPAALSLLLERLLDGSLEAESFGGRRVRATPGQPTDLALADVLLRRREETRALLAHDGVVVCFAVPATSHSGIDGLDALDDYYWLREPASSDAGSAAHGDDPAAASAAPAPLVTARMRAADGTRVSVTDFGHPLAAFVESQLANVAYRAYFDVAPDDRGAHIVFIESAGGMPVGVELPAAHGRVIFLPAMSPPGGEARYAAADALQEGIRRALGVMAEGRAPAWLDGERLPGVDELRAARAAARGRQDEATAAFAQAAAAYDERARYGRLLWQEGALGLEAVVVDALRLIGFDVYVSTTGEIELRTDIGAVVVEAEASEQAVGMGAHHRLRQRIERAIEQRGTAPRGLLVVNGYRLQAPDDRPPQISDAVRTAAETMRYCVATTVSLFAAAAAQLTDDDDAVRSYRERLLTTDGVVDRSRA